SRVGRKSKPSSIGFPRASLFLQLGHGAQPPPAKMALGPRSVRQTASPSVASTQVSPDGHSVSAQRLTGLQAPLERSIVYPSSHPPQRVAPFSLMHTRCASAQLSQLTDSAQTARASSQ